MIHHHINLNTYRQIEEQISQLKKHNRVFTQINFHSLVIKNLQFQF